MFLNNITKINMKNLLLVLLIFYGFSYTLFAQSDDRLKGLDSELEKVLKSLDETGFAVAIVEKNKVLYAEGFGYRDYENKIQVDANTLFAIGSCTKAFTSSILGLLNKEGKLDFEDSPIDYVKELRFYNAQMNDMITIRDLMSHRTGLPRHDFSWYFFPTFSKDSLIARIQYHEPFTSVRNKYYYNNFMFLLQGVIGERITGNLWEDNIRSMFFEPLGMIRSNLSIEEMKEEENAAIGYLEGHKETDYYKIAGMRPAGSINSSVNEMSKWLITWINGGKYGDKEILPASYVREAISSQNVMDARLPMDDRPGLHFANYGFGWSLSSYKGHYRVEHGGSIDGFQASAVFFPSDSVGVVILANQGGSSIPSIARNIIVDRMLEVEKTDWLKIALKDIKEAKKTQIEAKKMFTSNKKEGTKSSHFLEEYVGNYTNLGYGTIELIVENDSLFAISPYLKLWLNHYHYDTFQPVEVVDGKVDMDISYNEFLVTFSANGQGDIESLSAHFEPAIENPIVFDRKLNKIDVDKETLEKYVGNYELSADIIVNTYIKGDVLYVFVPGQPEYELYSIATDKFAFKILDGYKLEFKIDNKGKVIEISFIQPNGIFNYKKIK